MNYKSKILLSKFHCVPTIWDGYRNFLRNRIVVNFLMKKSVPSFRFCVHGTALYIPWSGTCRCAINDNSDGSNKNDLGRWLISANCAFRKFRSIGHRKTHFNGTELAEWSHDQSQMFCQFRIMRHTFQGALHPMGYGTTDMQNCETLVINCGFCRFRRFLLRKFIGRNTNFCTTHNA